MMILIEHALLGGWGSDHYIKKCQRFHPIKKQITLTGTPLQHPPYLLLGSPQNTPNLQPFLNNLPTTTATLQQVILTLTVCKSLILCHCPDAHFLNPPPLVAVHHDWTKKPSASFIIVSEEVPAEIHLYAPWSRFGQSLVTLRTALESSWLRTSPQKPSVHSPRAEIKAVA